MSYYKKLNIAISVPDMDTANWRLAQVADVPDRARYKYTFWEKEYAPPTPLHVYKIPQPIAETLLSQLPESIIRREIPGVFFMKMDKPHPASTVPPHVDVGRRTAINVYVECSGEVTEFFEADDVSKQLTSKGSFTARKGEAWLLNVSKPHAVRMTKAPLRACVSFSFRRLKFSELCELI